MLHSISRYTPSQALKASNNQRDGIKINGSDLLGNAIKLSYQSSPELSSNEAFQVLNRIEEMIGKIAGFTSQTGHVLNVSRLEHNRAAVRTPEEKPPSYINAELVNSYDNKEGDHFTLYSETEEPPLAKVNTLPGLESQISAIWEKVQALPAGIDSAGVQYKIDKIVKKASEAPRSPHSNLM
jgi:hypothetical protein